MKKKELQAKLLAATLTVSMSAGLYPAAVMAADVDADNAVQEEAYTQEGEEESAEDTQEEVEVSVDADSMIEDTEDDAGEIVTITEEESAPALETDDTDQQGGNQTENVEYLLMNIPYDKFYEADVRNDVAVDAFSSATLQKTRGSLSAGSYHPDNSGTSINGVIFPVKLGEGVTLDAVKECIGGGAQVTDESSISITTTNRGQTSTVEYKGREALFENPDYSYYVLNGETPTYYKEVTIADGSLVFGEVQGTRTTIEGATATLSTESSYGDYGLSIKGADDYIAAGDAIYGVVISTDSNDYGLRHMEKIWRATELAWCTGFTEAVHNCPTSSAHYQSIMGQTITKITYYTADGIYEINADIKVPVKSSEISVSVEDADVSAGTTSASITLPEGFTPAYSVVKSSNNETLSTAQISDDKTALTYSDAKPGSYKLVVADESGTYADVSTSFTLTTDKQAAAYNNDDADPKLVAADDADEADLNNYLECISSVTVNGTKYSTTGRGSVKVIAADGSIDTAVEANNAPVFAEDGEYSISVEATGYTEPLTFTYTKETAAEYQYVYAALSWSEYWASEDVYEAGSTEASDETDSKGELDKGAFDAVTRATTNHGLHRGNYQCSVTIYDTENNSYEMDHWTEDGSQIVLKNGDTVGFAQGIITKTDGTTATMSYYVVNGIKYVPVKVATADYEAFCEAYDVVENGGTLAGGYGEMNLTAYSVTAAVTENTNGLKTAVKNEDGTFTFSERVNNGSDSGIQDVSLKTAENVITTVVPANGSYGEFLRVDLTGDGYGDLGANMQAVEWTYYGDDSTYTTPLRSFGTKFAADNWMHKKNGIQLGLTESLRCQLPEGTDGTGYWTLTVHALGYADYTVQFEATEDNIVVPEEEEADTTALAAAIESAEALKESDYTAKSWADMQTELNEAKDELAAPKTQATVDEAVSHLKAAIDGLVKKSASTITLKSKTTTYTGKTISIGTASVKGSTGKVTYTYYTDSKCTKKTTASANGAASTGAAPKYAGTYYVKAYVASDANYTSKTSSAVKLTINKAASTITLKSKTVTYTGKTNYIGTATKKGSSGKVTYTYYTNSSCTKKTTKSANGAASTGAAPKYAGTYYVKAYVASSTNYASKTSSAVKLTVKKASQTVSVKTSSKTYKASSVKKASQTFSIGASAKGSLKYAKSSGSSKLSVNSKTGKITVKKGTAKGTYTIKVKITAASTTNYASKTITKTITVKVK